MKAVYKGHVPGAVSAFGTTFSDGKESEVDDRFAKKLNGNPFFDVVGEKAAGGLRAVHRGRGSYSIMSGDTEVKEGLSKADADAFNAMSDEDRATYAAD